MQTLIEEALRLAEQMQAEGGGAPVTGQVSVDVR